MAHGLSQWCSIRVLMMRSMWRMHEVDGAGLGSREVGMGSGVVYIYCIEPRSRVPPMHSFHCGFQTGSGSCAYVLGRMAEGGCTRPHAV